MAYTIDLRVVQGAINDFAIVEKTGWWYSGGGEWTERHGSQVLSLGSGTSGMLRFTSSSGEAFCLALGVHNHKRWCDIIVDLEEDDTAEKIHPDYYVPGGSPMLWKQLSKITKTTARGKKLALQFSVKKGSKLSAELTISKPLNLLSLDGGGIRGLSALIALEYLMRRVNLERQGRDHVKPCDVFDLIAGTGTGGLIAIMLGRLRMEVSDCRREYKRLMKTIWSRSRAFGKRLDFTVLRDAMTSLNDAAEEPFYVEDEQQCRVFVCVKSAELNTPVRICSYGLPSHPILVDRSATIAQVAQATCASSELFDPVQIGERRFADGGLGVSNPVDEIWREAANIWCPDSGDLEPRVQCLVSIGTGDSGLYSLDEITARAFVERWRSLLHQRRYSRFNVEQGLQDVRLEQHKKQNVVEIATDHYFQHQEQAFKV